MELLIYLKSLGRYLSESPEHVREELAKELRERLHQKETCSTQFAPHVEELDVIPTNNLARLIVRDPNAPASVLSRLATSQDKEVLERIAEHSQVAPYTLSLLADCIHHEVRVAVAENHNTPFHTQFALADDVHPDVRYRLAENPHVSIAILLKLEEDENPYVSMRATATIERLDLQYTFAA